MASAWTKGIETIESILQPECDAFTALTDPQKEGLEELKKVLTSFHTRKEEMYIPLELLNKYQDDEGVKDDETAKYLVQSFGGIKQSKRSMKTIVKKTITLNRFVKGLASMNNVKGDTITMDQILPPEWFAIPKENRLKLRQMLSWENISEWDFNVIELDKLSGGNPLLFAGWAILASPTAEYAMAIDCGENPESVDEFSGYGFANTFHYTVPKLNAFLRSISNDYNDVPYHNKTHAADVLQSLHSILQMGGKDYADEIQIFALLVAATAHDIAHPGRNNNYQVSSRSSYAINYNDKSCLENMHAALLFKRLVGDDKLHDINIFGRLTEAQLSVIRKVIVEAILHTDMTKHFALLGDMANILKSVKIEEEEVPVPDSDDEGPNSPKTKDETKTETDGDKVKKDVNGSSHKKKPRASITHRVIKMGSEDREKVLCFMLHAADISNPAKPAPMFQFWTDKCLQEFFEQGDEEKARGLPISPLCNRETTPKEQSQIGFIKFVVEPTYEVLGGIIQNVKREVMPVIGDNKDYWQSQLKAVI